MYIHDFLTGGTCEYNNSRVSESHDFLFCNGKKTNATKINPNEFNGRESVLYWWDAVKDCLMDHPGPILIYYAFFKQTLQLLQQI